MANTTDLMISCSGEGDKMFGLFTRSGLRFEKVSDAEKCGGSRVIVMESFAYCARCLGEQKIKEFISEFKRTPFAFPESAVLIVDDDDNEYLNGVYLMPRQVAR